MTSYREDDLALVLRELRPTPRPEFVAGLDARVAAGFPRRPLAIGSALGRAIEWLRATPPRRLLMPMGGIAVAAVIVATAVVATTQDDSGQPARTTVSKVSGAAGETAELAAPSSGTPPAPKAEAGPQSAPNFFGASGAANSGAAEAEVVAPPRTGPYAAHHAGRDIERGASITLADKPSQIRSDATEVFEAVHAANGVVLRSAIRDSSAGEAGADFELLIPTARLSDAMASFSGIAEVRARHESTQDITAPTVSARERLQDSAARVKGLLAQLAAAETNSRRAAAEAELYAARRRMAVVRSQLTSLERRANLSHVSLRIESMASSQGSAWGIGDGFVAAGRLLAIAAGVTVIGLAALAPLALLALLAWLARQAYLRRVRARALA